MNKFLDRRRSLGFSLLIGMLIGMSIAVVFAAGFFFRDLINLSSSFASASAVDSSGYPLLNEVQSLLDEHYLREQPDHSHRQYAAIRGMLISLDDRFTFFIDPPVAQSESDVLAGAYGGIGVQVNRDELGEFILYPFQDSPALAAGIEAGDILKAVNNQPVELTTQQDVIDQMLRGEVKEGNGVEITVLKKTGDTLTVFIPFGVINVPSVLWYVLPDDESIGYIQVLRFTSRTPEELRIALEDLNQASISALILDLRNNAGGLLQESVEVAGVFLDRDQVVLYERDKQSERTFKADDRGEAVDLPLVVLVNQGTASAAELVAGAIQDNERGILIGQRTYGKGTVQQIFRLSDDSSLHITSAEWLTPGRAQLEGNGLEPNISMIPAPDGRDVEIGEAVRQLREMIQAAAYTSEGVVSNG